MQKTPRRAALLLIGAVAAGAACHSTAVEKSAGGRVAAAEQAAAAPAVAVLRPSPADLLPNGKEAFEGVLVGGQPTAEQLAAARDAGYRTVINLRPFAEPGAAAEPGLVAELGLDYVLIPVAGAAGLTEANARRLDDALAAAEYPVIVHCASGNRVGGLFALRAFYLEGKSAEEALELGRDTGLTRLEPAVREKLATAPGGG